MYNFVAWKARSGMNLCSLSRIDNVENPIDLQKGLPMDDWPENAVMIMDANYPKALKLEDNVYNLRSFIVASKALKDVVEEQNPPDVQFLPVAIQNHKGKIASRDYFIIHPTRLEDCIEIEKSGVEWNPIDEDIISVWETLVVDEARINPTSILFRFKQAPTKILVRRELADALESAGFSGLRFVNIEGLEP